MKVLMFGWEFPPHVSGGLGTACYGLTRSLANLGVEILFVAPKAESRQPFPGTELISASEVHVPTEKTTLKQEEIGVGRPMPGQPRFQSIAVRSELKPYFFVDERGKHQLERWNYQPYSKRKREVLTSQTLPGKRYSFSGGYGPRLLEEVRAYAVVAETLAGAHSFDVIHAHDWLASRPA